MGINFVLFWLCSLKNYLLLTNAYFLQATRCSFTGRLDSDPDSTVYVSGCKSEKENMDITLMSKKVKATSKHLKGRLGPRVGGDTFLAVKGRSGPHVGGTRFWLEHWQVRKLFWQEQKLFWQIRKLF